jgi:hypothetical protein
MLSLNMVCLTLGPRLKAPVVTPCRHLFCRACLEAWLGANNKETRQPNSTCPVCRFQIPVTFSDEEQRQGEQRVFLELSADGLLSSYQIRGQRRPTTSAIEIEASSSFKVISMIRGTMLENIITHQ